MTALSLIAQVKAKPGKEAELGAILQGLLAPTRQEEGCLTYDLHVANDDPGLFMFYETWKTHDLWERHMQAPHLEAFKARTDELVGDWKLFQLTRIG